MKVVVQQHVRSEDLTRQLLVLHRGEVVYGGGTADFLRRHAPDPAIEVRFADGRVHRAAKPEWGALLSAAAAEAGSIAEIRTELPSLAEAFFAAIAETREPVGEKV